jgi:hypothetical protein
LTGFISWTRLTSIIAKLLDKLINESFLYDLNRD